MALKIRLTKVGSVHQPLYRVVVAEARSRRDGDAVENLGTYTPKTKGNPINLKLDRVAGVFGGNEMTVNQVLEWVVIGHTADHLGTIRGTLA